MCQFFSNVSIFLIMSNKIEKIAILVRRMLKIRDVKTLKTIALPQKNYAVACYHTLEEVP